MTPETKGILLRLSTAFFATGLGACVHGAAQLAPISQVVAFRSGLSIPFLVFYGVASGPWVAMVPRAWRMHALRGGLGGIGMSMNFVALAYLPVAQAKALGYLAPVLTVPLAVWMLGEALTWRLVIAVALGFAGVLAMLGVTGAMGEHALLGVAGGLGFAAIMAVLRIYIKRMTETESTASIALSFAVIGTIIGIALAPFGGPWIWPEGALAWWLIGTGSMGALVHITATEAVRHAPVSVLAPFDYTGLIWALLLDWLVFSNVPGVWGYVGTGLITGAAVLIALRPRVS